MRSIAPSVAGSVVALASLVSCTPTATIARLDVGDEAGAANDDGADAGAASTTSSAVLGNGVSLAGAEFAPTKLPGTFGVDYVYPTHAEVDYYAAKGARVLGFPVLWERLQPVVGGELDTTELARADDFVTYATAAGERVVLDLHSYGAYAGAVVGVDPSVPAASYADIWTRLATHYGSNASVVFSLSNAERSTPPATWVGVANAAIAAIRQAGATGLVLVAGGGPADASQWDASYVADAGAPDTDAATNPTSDADVMLGIVDPANNFLYQLTQFLDADATLASDSCVSATIGSERLKPVMAWLRAHQRRAFLAEFGAGVDPVCLAALTDVVQTVDAAGDVWAGWSYWAGGPMWGGYTVSIEPIDGGDRPQLTAFGGHF